MYKDTAVVLIVLLQPMIELLYLRLHQEADNVLFKLPAALAGDNLNQSDPIFDRLGDDAVQLRVDGRALVVNLMQIQFDLSHRFARWVAPKFLSR